MSCIYCCTKILISYYLFAKVLSNAIIFCSVHTSGCFSLILLQYSTKEQCIQMVQELLGIKYKQQIGIFGNIL